MRNKSHVRIAFSLNLPPCFDLETNHEWDEPSFTQQCPSFVCFYVITRANIVIYCTKDLQLDSISLIIYSHV